jgi:hypothetical protein
MLAMHGFQATKSKMRVHLCSGNISVAKYYLHTAQICSVFHHVCGATMPQAMRTGGFVGRLYEMPYPLAGERHSAK